MDTSRLNVFALAACQALLVTNNVMMISIGTLAADTLARNKLFVTVPATAYIIGGTTLRTECYTPAEKAKMQGINDLLIYVTMGATSLSSGAILYKHGWSRLNYSALPLLVLTAVAILWLAALRRPVAVPGTIK